MSDKNVEESEDFWRDSFSRHHDFIVERMLTDFGLIDKLYSTKVVTNKEKNKVKAETTIQDRNQTLLECIKSKADAHGKLAEMLNKSEQTHLFNYLKSDGVYKTDFGGDWPLTEKEISTFDDNFSFLFENLNTDDVSGLYETKVINRLQREFISSKQTFYEKNEALLEILRRGSRNSYWNTVKWLHRTNQDHIAEILKKGGVIVAVHAHIEPADEQTEDEIINNFAKVLRNRPLDESRRIFERTLNVIAMKKGQSIIIYIYCKTLNELNQLIEKLLNGKLGLFVKTLFTQLIRQPLEVEVTGSNLKSVSKSVHNFSGQHKLINGVTLTSSEETWQKCFQYFSCTRKDGISDSSTLLSELPLELLDIILKKVFLNSSSSKDNSSHEKDYDVIKDLLSVDFCWFQRITKMSFKKAIWSYFRKFYQTKLNSSLIYKNNRQFVQENFQFIKQPKRMKCFNCLSDIESVIINRMTFSTKSKQRQSRKSVTNIPALTKFSDDIRLNAFVRCLRRCGERFMERIINNTEAVLRVELRNKIASKETESTEWELNRRQLATSTYEAGKIFSQMEDDGLEILSTFEDRETVIWIWVNSSEAAKCLKVANDYTILHKRFREMVTEKFCIETSETFNIDSDQMHKEFELYSQMNGNLKAILEFKSNRTVRGITKLRNYIYAFIRAQSDHVIEIYEDKRPFSVLKRIKINDLEEIFAIFSNEKDKCIYAVGADNFYVAKVWLIIETETDSEKAFEVSEPFTAGEFGDYILRGHLPYVYGLYAVRCDGEMMVFDKNHPANLIFFGSKGKRLRSISLHEDIFAVLNAVQTSTGHFIAVCKMKKPRSLTQRTTDEKKETEKRKDDNMCDAQMYANAGYENNAINIANTAPDDGDDDINHYDEDLNRKVLSLCKVSQNGKKIIGYFDLEAIGISVVLHSTVSVDSCDCVFLAGFNERVFLFDPNLLCYQFLDLGQNYEVSRSIGTFHDYEKKQLIVQKGDGFNIFTLSLK